MRKLLAEYLPSVYRFALRLTGDPHAAEDITQETMLRGWRNRRNLRCPQAARTWLFRIAANLWCDQLRRSLLAPAGGDSDVSSPLARTRRPDESADSAEAVRLALRCLDSLPPRQRQVLYLSSMEGLSHIQIAEALAISVDAVKANLSLARKTMRRRLDGMLSSE